MALYYESAEHEPSLTYHLTDCCHEMIYDSSLDPIKAVRVHQLVAIAGGADPHEVFDDSNHVHHRNGIPWDNRSENVELMTASEHRKFHWENGDHDTERQNLYTDAELLQWIESYVELWGMPPLSSNTKNWPGPTADTYRRHFGSYDKAVKMAGYTPRSET